MIKSLLIIASIFAIGLVGLSINVSAEERMIPSWIKNNAGWWAEGQIDDQTFVNGIQFLIKEDIIQVSKTTSASNNYESIPEWVKSTAGWWAASEISETEFLNAMQYVIKIGLIKIDEDSSEKIIDGYSTNDEIMNDPNLSATKKLIFSDKLHPWISGYRGATFDGEIVYFAPYYNNYGRHGLMIKYNTTQPFDDPNSWDVNNVGAVCVTSDCTIRPFVGYQGVLYHNGFVYYVPYFIGKSDPGSLVLRYDTSLDFRDPSAWVSSGYVAAYEDGVVVGDHVYFSPHLDKKGERNTIPLRYDTTKPFADSAAWESIEVGLEASYIGAASDGKKIYYAPWGDDSKEGSSIMIYDSEKPISENSSWDFISIPYSNYSGAGFNGTHIVFAPCWCPAGTSNGTSKIMFLNVDTQEVSFSTSDYGAYNGVIEADNALYLVADITKNGTRSDFIEVTNSIKTFSPTIAKGGYWGGTYDGQYVYFVPFGHPNSVIRNGEFLRYDTTKPFEDDTSWELISFAITDFKYNYNSPDIDIFSKEWLSRAPK